MYKIIADLHTHSLRSGHAYSSIAEMAQSAADKGLYAIAITDHTGFIPEAPKSWYFENMASSLPLYYKDVMLLCGMETNVLDFEGHIELQPTEAKALDWIVASIHDINLEGLENPNIEKSTELWMNVAKNPHVNVIGHSGDPRFEYDYDKVIPEFGKNGKLVEINSHTFDGRKRYIPNCRRIAEACMRHKVPIVVNSDAHSEFNVANFGNALHMLEELNFPEELIINSSVERLNTYLEEYSRVFDRKNRKER